MRRVLLAGTVLLCLATLAACDLRPGGQRLSKTPTGAPCNYVPSDQVSGSHAFAAHMGALCIYYVRDDHGPTACEPATSHDWCPSTNFDFYLYSEDDGQTYYCNQVNHFWCPVGTAHPVMDLAILCPWPNFAYDHLVDIGQTWVVIAHAKQHNATKEPSQFTFTAPMPSPNYPSWSGVRNSYTDEGFDAIVSSVKHGINPNVQSYVDTAGIIAQVTIPPGRTMYWLTRVNFQTTEGHLYARASCTGHESDFQTVTTYLPITADQCVWLDGDEMSRYCTS